MTTQTPIINEVHLGNGGSLFNLYVDGLNYAAYNQVKDWCEEHLPMAAVAYMRASSEVFLPDDENWRSNTNPYFDYQYKIVVGTTSTEDTAAFKLKFGAGE